MFFTPSQEHYIGFTAHYLDRQFEMKSVVLEVRKYSERQTIDNLAPYLRQRVARYFPEKGPLIVSVTIDGAKNYQGAVRDFVGTLERIWCIDHLLNLAGKDTAAEVLWKDDITSLRRLQNFVIGHLQVLRRFQSACITLLGRQYEFVPEAETRWLYFGDTLDRVVLVFPALNELFEEGLFKADPDTQEFMASQPLGKLKLMAACVAIVREMLLKCEARNEITAPFVPLWLNKVYNRLSRRLDKLPLDSSLRQYPLTLLEQLHNRMDYIYNVVNPMLMACALHPKTYELAFCSDTVKTDVYNYVIRTVGIITGCPDLFREQLLSGIHAEMAAWGTRYPAMLGDPDCARLFWCNLSNGTTYLCCLSVTIASVIVDP